MTEPDADRLSVVIPAYNEEARLGSTLTRVIHYLGDHGSDFEILVVDDGSTDDTRKIASDFPDDRVRVIPLPRNSGKGAAVRRGVLASQGAWVLISDADLSTPIEEIERLEQRAEEADLVLGSRAMSASRITRRQPLFRELMGKTFNLLIRLLGLTDINDTQCGFKLIRGDVARELFQHMKIDRFAFDVELVWLARRRGHRVVEAGVVWHDSPTSRVDLTRDSLNMLIDVIRLRFRR